MQIIKRCSELGVNGCVEVLARKARKKTIKMLFFAGVYQSRGFKHRKPSVEFLDKIWIKFSGPNPATHATVNRFDLLGSGIQCFEKIPWHQDFKVEKSPTAWKTEFYQNIKPATQENISLDKFNPDIKVPWELSRFQHIFELGQAYKTARERKDTQSCLLYSETFQNQVSDWIDKNPYLIGVNWVCPMDVAIRAINLIWGFYFFKDANNISTDFWNKLLDSLYKHKQYLEFNWETSDKPNNHYISDLIGYFYLCEFLQHKRAKHWCYKKILEQFFHQVQPDGTCYEGSTNYHKLDTELFLHFKLICEATDLSLPEEFLERFEKMIKFLQDCTDSSGQLVAIGDNDSGKVVTGLEPAACKKRQGIRNYPNFGLAIIKHPEAHITLRYPAFKKNQPTGHFHQDWLAVTLSIGNIPVLVDPGTYVYTANSSWRNLMRGAQAHNTFHATEIKQTSIADLFQLRLEQQENTLQIDQAQDRIRLTSFNKIHESTTAWRTLEFNATKKTLILSDRIDTKNELKIEWNLNFDPEINLMKLDSKNWIVKRKETSVCQIFSTLDFVLLDGFYSKSYGHIQKCPRLSAKKLLLNETQVISIQPLS